MHCFIVKLLCGNGKWIVKEFGMCSHSVMWKASEWHYWCFEKKQWTHPDWSSNVAQDTVGDKMDPAFTFCKMATSLQTRLVFNSRGVKKAKYNPVWFCWLIFNWLWLFIVGYACTMSHMLRSGSLVGVGSHPPPRGSSGLNCSPHSWATPTFGLHTSLVVFWVTEKGWLPCAIS